MTIIQRGSDIIIGLDFLYCGNTKDIRPIFTEFQAEFWTDDETNTVSKGLNNLRIDSDGDYYVILNSDEYQYQPEGIFQYKITYAVESNEFTDQRFNKTVKGFSPYKLVDTINKTVNKGVIWVDEFPLAMTAARDAIYIKRSTNEMRSTYDNINWRTLNADIEGAVSINQLNDTINEHNTALDSHYDIRQLIIGLTERVTQLENQLANAEYVQYPEVFNYTGSNIFTLSKQPRWILEIRVLADNSRYTLEDSDYTLNGSDVTINNPVLVNGMRVKIIYVI